MYLKLNHFLLYNMNWFLIVFIKKEKKEKKDTCMGDDIYGCFRERIEEKDDEGQVGSALHVTFLHSYIGCFMDVCFTCLNALTL